MKNRFLKYTLGSTAIALVLAASSAQAVLINTFSASDNLSTLTASFGSPALSVDVQAYVRQNGTVTTANVATINQSNAGGNGGLGVDHRNMDGVDNDSNWGQIDNLQGDEWLTFSSTSGTITGIYLALFSRSEQVRIIGSNNANFLGGGCVFGSCYVDLVSDGGRAGVGGLASQFDYFSLNDTSYKYISVFAGEGGNFDAGGINDLYRVRAVEVIPEPSIIALFGLGLVGLGLSARRRRKV